MKPINYVDSLNEYYGSLGNPPYRWTVNETAPLSKPTKPLNEAVVTFLTSGGVSHCTMPGFNPDARNDHRLDTVAKDADSQDFQIHDSYYDTRDAVSDLNCLLPIDRLREMESTGEVGKIAAHLWSGFMGRIYNRTKLIEESAPAFIEKLKQDKVDILLTGPA